MIVFQSFTRLAEQVLQANKKDLDVLRVSLTDQLDLAALEEDDGRRENGGNVQKSCWC